MSNDDLLRLGALEKQVMETLWELQAATIRDIITFLPSDPAYTTIATVLKNLKRKKLVVATTKKHSTTYRPAVSQPHLSAGLMGQVLDLSLDRRASILQFVETMSEEDLTILRAYLKDTDDT